MTQPSLAKGSPAIPRWARWIAPMLWSLLGYSFLGFSLVLSDCSIFSGWAKAETIMQNPGANQPPPQPGYQPGPALNQAGQLPSPPTARNIPGPSPFVPAPSTAGIGKTLPCFPPAIGAEEPNQQLRYPRENTTTARLLNETVCSDVNLSEQYPQTNSQTVNR